MAQVTIEGKRMKKRFLLKKLAIFTIVLPLSSTAFAQSLNCEKVNCKNGHEVLSSLRGAWSTLRKSNSPYENVCWNAYQRLESYLQKGYPYQGPSMGAAYLNDCNVGLKQLKK